MTIFLQDRAGTGASRGIAAQAPRTGKEPAPKCSFTTATGKRKRRRLSLKYGVPAGKARKSQRTCALRMDLTAGRTRARPSSAPLGHLVANGAFVRPAHPRKLRSRIRRSVRGERARPVTSSCSNCCRSCAQAAVSYWLSSLAAHASVGL